MPRIRRSSLALVLILAVSLGAASALAETCEPGVTTTTTTYAKIAVVEIHGMANFHFVAGMAIDADGAPNAYGPDGKGLDFLANAGKPGNWWALVTDTGKPSGKPVVQSDTDPAPGYYVSTTALEDTSKNRRDPRRYVDAATIPYIVLPPDLAKAHGVRLGDFALVRRPVSDDDEGSAPVTVGAIYADVGPKGKLGEGSIALAKALGLPPDPKKGGAAGGVTYIVLPGSGNGKPRTADEIATETKALIEKYRDVASGCAGE
jgi:hypothetical protein